MAKEANGPNSTILGAAGEHFVMSQLLRRNIIAALAPTGVPNADIVVTDKLGDRLCAVQVKVRRDIGSDGGWHMGQKHEELVSPNLFYSLSILENRSPTSRKHGSFRAELSPNLSRKFIRIGCTRLERRGSSAMTAPSDASCPITIPCLSTSWDGSTLTLKIGRPSKPRLGSDARTEVAISLKFGRTSNLVMTPLRHPKF